jgi:hypothetical protein
MGHISPNAETCVVWSKPANVVLHLALPNDRARDPKPQTGTCLNDTAICAALTANACVPMSLDVKPSTADIVETFRAANELRHRRNELRIVAGRCVHSATDGVRDQVGPILWPHQLFERGTLGCRVEPRCPIL